MSKHPEPVGIRVHPEPTPEEMTAISAAVAALASRPYTDREESPSGVDSRERWREAARREILRSSERDS
ncbi:MAG TPA: hypothetical protein VGR29_03520 [Thermomicrobiales bacterium]|nr:hypothetical protein [Thermomicrobiales bacterium]